MVYKFLEPMKKIALRVKKIPEGFERMNTPEIDNKITPAKYVERIDPAKPVIEENIVVPKPGNKKKLISSEESTK
ncbi:MAG: hypothetical protein INQ03_21570 [Candidatus Heimdallarchaeota archaeon]|nr:hypothetical protein [Candidatus Heimdallarchaeota archaeon]